MTEQIQQITRELGAQYQSEFPGERLDSEWTATAYSDLTRKAEVPFQPVWVGGG